MNSRKKDKTDVCRTCGNEVADGVEPKKSTPGL
jgi:hypothetical protein